VAIEIGILFALLGALAALVGRAGMRRSRRLRSSGVAVWAMSVPPSGSPVTSAGDADVTVLQYELADGRVIVLGAAFAWLAP
jgi:hypothetical protein